jgi:predicted RNase H-like HicB family nuclease
MKVSVGNCEFTIIVEEAPEGGFSAQCKELPSVISQGKTLKDPIQLVLDIQEDRF